MKIFSLPDISIGIGCKNPILVGPLFFGVIRNIHWKLSYTYKVNSFKQPYFANLQILPAHGELKIDF